MPIAPHQNFIIPPNDPLKFSIAKSAKLVAASNEKSWNVYCSSFKDKEKTKKAEIKCCRSSQQIPTIKSSEKLEKLIIQLVLSRKKDKDLLLILSHLYRSRRKENRES